MKHVIPAKITCEIAQLIGSIVVAKFLVFSPETSLIYTKVPVSNPFNPIPAKNIQKINS